MSKMTDRTDGTTTAAKAIPKEGYFEPQPGRYGPVFGKTPACYGFSIVAKVIPVKEEHLYNHAKVIEDAISADPNLLSVLKAHYLK
jgi:hypothetical protein